MTNSPNRARLVYGAQAISEHLFGNADKATVRRVRHLAATGAAPIFKVGGMLAIDPADVDGWIAQQKQEAAKRREARKAPRGPNRPPRPKLHIAAGGAR
jgi:hypothetical protein